MQQNQREKIKKQYLHPLLQKKHLQEKIQKRTAKNLHHLNLKKMLKNHHHQNQNHHLHKRKMKKNK